MASKAFLQQAYLAYFGRPADPSGLAYYAEKTEAQVKAAFSASPESQAFFGSMAVAAQINTIYQNLFNRDAEPAGLAYWSQEIGSGRLSLADAAMGILAGAQNDDKTAVTNKLAASDAFTAKLDTTAEILGYAGSAAISPARAYLKAVDATAASLTTATTGVDASVASVVAAGSGSTNPGQTFTLTSGVETLSPTSATAALKTTDGNDLFRATATDHLSSADFIDAGAGTDTLNAVQTAATAGVTIKPLLKSVEIINLTGTGVGTDSASSITLDLADSTGVEQVWSKDSVGAASASTAFTMNFNNLAAGVQVGIDGGALGSSNGVAPSLTVGVKDAATNTADALTINLKNALANVVTAADIETITLKNSNTTATATSTITELAASKVKTLNIDGSGTLTVTGLGTTTAATLTKLNITGSGKNTITTAAGTQTALKTIDASTATGNNTVVISGTAIANTKVTMGTGNDTVTFDSSANVATAIGTEGAVAGGDGKDTLKFAEATLDATDATAIAKATGFEVLETSYAGVSTTAGVSVSASDFTGISEFVFSGATVGKIGTATGSGNTNIPGVEAVKLTNIENNDVFVFTKTQTGAAAVSVNNGGSQGAIATAAVTTAAKLDGGANVLNITLKSSSTDEAAHVDFIGGKGAAQGSGTVDTKAGAVGIEASTFETVNLISSGKAATSFTGANIITGGASDTNVTAGNAMTLNTNGKLVITGDKHLDLSAGVAGTNVTVDASGFTGMLKVKTVGASSNNTLIGGSMADELEGGAGVDTYTGNGGKDKFIIADTEAGTTGGENITDFALGSDILDLTSTKTNIADVVTATSIASSSTIVGIQAGDTLLATVSKGIVTLTGTAVSKVDTVAEVLEVFKALDNDSVDAEIGAIVMGGNTYVVFESAGGDTLADVVQLVGVTNATSISTTAATGVITIG